MYSIKDSTDRQYVSHRITEKDEENPREGTEIKDRRNKKGKKKKEKQEKGAQRDTKIVILESFSHFENLCSFLEIVELKFSIGTVGN